MVFHIDPSAAMEKVYASVLKMHWLTCISLLILSYFIMCNLLSVEHVKFYCADR
jgi:hypothetical protein